MTTDLLECLSELSKFTPEDYDRSLQEIEREISLLQHKHESLHRLKLLAVSVQSRPPTGSPSTVPGSGPVVDAAASESRPLSTKTAPTQRPESQPPAPTILTISDYLTAAGPSSLTMIARHFGVAVDVIRPLLLQGPFLDRDSKWRLKSA